MYFARTIAAMATSLAMSSAIAVESRGLEKGNRWGVSAELAKMPSADSLCGDVKVVHFKKDAAKLVRGNNVEPVIERLSSAASRGGPEADEARALVASARKACGELKRDIRNSAKMHRPGLALIQLETLVKTWPSEKTNCAKVLQKLAASKDVKAAVRLRQALEAAESTVPKSDLDARKLEASKNEAIKAAAPFAKSEFPGVAEEIAELIAGVSPKKSDGKEAVSSDSTKQDHSQENVDKNYKTSEKFPLTIRGDDAFIKRTEDALSLIRDKAPKSYANLTNYYFVIQKGEISGIRVRATPPVFSVGDRTANASLHWYASCIVHDANHLKLYKDYYKKFKKDPPKDTVYSGREAENACLSVQQDFYREIDKSSPKIEYLERMKSVDYFSSQIKRDW